ncbi:MAG: RHS repeat-associated core domain-containing protein [Thermodesulfovibrionales bacterium]
MGSDKSYRVFISEDPIGLLGGINKYDYVNNRPTMLFDPLGLINTGKVISGLGQVAFGVGALVVLSTAEVASAGAATAIAISVAAIAAPAISSGVMDIMLGFSGSSIEAPSAQGPSLAALIISGNVKTANDVQFYYDLFMTTKGSFDLLTKSPQTAENVLHFIELVNLQNESLKRALKKGKSCEQK